MNNLDVLSCSKTTILSSFPDCTQKYEYRNNDLHQGGSGFDFQFFNGKPLYAQYNKRNRVDFFRIKPLLNENGIQNVKIERIKKILLDNVSCVGVPKTRNINKHNKDLAFGFANGQIKFVNYYTSETSDTTFSSDIRSNGVLNIDYNCSDEYLSAIYENGNINLYGIKTKTKLETLKMDNCTFARFHPIRKSHLAVATYKGASYIYDLHSKRKVFHSVDSHSAPCRDLCFPTEQPDTFLTAGYDCVAKIYDTRRRGQPIQIACRHPISCIVVSDCGTYCCMGNLKGQLLSYDLRNLRNHLSSNKLYVDGVSRIAFLSNELYKERESLDSAIVQNYSEVEATCKSVDDKSTAHTGRDSFYDLLDFHIYRGNNQRDDRLSTNSNRFLVKQESFDWDILNKRKSVDIENLTSESSSQQQISSENYDFEQETIALQQYAIPDDGRKSSININSLILSDGKSRLAKVAEETSGSPVVIEENQLNKKLQEKFTKQIEQLQLEFNKRISDLQFELKYTAETNKWQSYTQSCNFWNKQLDFNEVLKNAMDILLRTDSFYIEFEKLKEENELLKRKLGEKKY